MKRLQSLQNFLKTMSLQYRFFQIPAAGDNKQEQVLNTFLRSVRVVHIEKKFLTEPDPGWAFLVEYYHDGKVKGSNETQRKRKDYRNELSPDDFAVYARLREWRNKQAEELSQPPYTIFTNEELSALATCLPQDIRELKKINGIGEAKAAKYGEEVLERKEQYPPGAGNSAGWQGEGAGSFSPPT